MSMPPNTSDKVLILHDRPEIYIDGLKARFPDLVFETCSEAGAVAETVEAVQPSVAFSVKCKGLPGPIHRPIMQCRSLRWIHVGGAGIEHLGSWDPRRLSLSNCAGVLSRFQAETVLGAMLMLNFGFHRYLRQQDGRLWQSHPWTSLEGKTLLLVGLGNIGRQVAAKAKQQGMRVIGVRNRPQATENVDAVHSVSDLAGLLPEADFVSLHVPVTAETRQMIDAEALARMRPEAFLLNTARGAVVDEAALVEALRRGRIAGAYLDVFASEPLPADSPLWRLENVVVSPHTSDMVADWEARFAAFFEKQLKRWLAGQPLDNVIDPARGY